MTNRNLFSLKGKLAVVTGGYGYIGRHISKALAQFGASVVVTGKNRNKFRNVFPEDKNIYFELMDVSSSRSVSSSFRKILKQHKSIDILINCAFFSSGNDPLHLTDEEWDKGIDGSLTSVYRTTREIIPVMKKNRSGGVILNIASIYGVVSPDFSIYKEQRKFTNLPSYGCAKAGVIALTRYFAVYLAKDKIRVNSLTLGPFPSPLVQKQTEFIKKLELKSPIGRIGNPSETAGPAVFLVSEASSYITGQNVIVDGGWTVL